jgi:hypothetical protein
MCTHTRVFRGITRRRLRGRRGIDRIMELGFDRDSGSSGGRGVGWIANLFLRRGLRRNPRCPLFPLMPYALWFAGNCDTVWFMRGWTGNVNGNVSVSTQVLTWFRVWG